MSAVKPQLFQGNVWQVIFDPALMAFLRQHDIHFQAYNVFGGIVQNFDRKPNTFRRIKTIADDLSATPVQVILRWLLQQDISIVPRSSRREHLAENAGVSLVSALSAKQMEDVQLAVRSFLRPDVEDDVLEDEGVLSVS